jgi:hypothetical protein
MTIEAPLLVGYYRCTDILFHYHESLKNSRETIQLQKILSNCPFRRFVRFFMQKV